MKHRDLVAKYLELSEDVGAYILLDPNSNDPIVKNYLNGSRDNDYMIHMMLDMTDAEADVVDLGCHVGTFSIAAAALGRHVTSVDANKTHTWLVEGAARLNGLRNIEIKRLAVSTNRGVVRFKEDGLFGHIDHEGATTGVVEVSAAPLSDIIGSRAIAFLKIDIEGAEYDALISGEDAIRTHKPSILYESNGPTLELFGRTVDDVRSLLETWGYKCFRPWGGAWAYAPPGQLQPEAWVDLLAVHDSKISLLRGAIHWEFGPEDMLQLCRTWAALPYPNTKTYLAKAIRRLSDAPPSLSELALSLERELAG